MVDTYRGQVRLRAWPRKRGTPKSAAVRRQNAWFKDANQLAKVLEPTQMNLAIAMTKGTGLYPRDLLLKQMSGGMYALITDDGQEIPPRKRFRETIMFQGVILQLLSTQPLVTGLLTVITFPLPLLDTLGFWNPAEPTRVTIPAGINVVKIDAGWQGDVSTPNQREQIMIFKNGSPYRNQQGFSVSTPAQTVVMGSDHVVAGDFFELKIACPLAQSAKGTRLTFLTLNVLDAD